ncbi:MAG: cation diffusion facilitator family transporter [Bacillota bacterium]
MKYLASRLVHKLTDKRDLIKPAERYRIGIIESWVSILGNIVLTLLKLIFGLLINSIALIADAAHSASDIFSSLAVLIGFSLARRKPDREHPHGHGRIEYLAGLIIAVMLTGAGVAFFYSSYIRLIEEVFATPSIAAIIAVITAILIKEFMYHFSAELGTLIKSEALTGDAWHHRSDSLSSAMVLLALTGGYFGLPVLDAYFGFAIALFIIYTGLKIALKSCSRLLGTAQSEELQERVLNCAKEIDGVIDAHELEVHDYGSWKVVTIHIGVSALLSLDEAHLIAHRVEEHISSNCHCDTVVHLDPR